MAYVHGQCGVCGSPHSIEKDMLICPLEEWVERRGLKKLWDDFRTALLYSGGVLEDDVDGTLRCLFHSLRQKIGELGIVNLGRGMGRQKETIQVDNSRDAGQAEIEKCYQEFWKDIVSDTEGNLLFNQIKCELFDFHTMMETVPLVYCEVTGGSVSKPLTHADAVIGEYERILEDRIEEAVAEAKEDWLLEHGLTTEGAGDITETTTQVVVIDKSPDELLHRDDATSPEDPNA